MMLEHLKYFADDEKIVEITVKNNHEGCIYASDRIILSPKIMSLVIEI
jgi:Holliday junction resolvase RusA-like endonuclease